MFHNKETDLVKLLWPVEANASNELNSFKMQLADTEAVRANEVSG